MNCERCDEYVMVGPVKLFGQVTALLCHKCIRAWDTDPRVIKMLHASAEHEGKSELAKAQVRAGTLDMPELKRAELTAECCELVDHMVALAVEWMAEAEQRCAALPAKKRGD